MREQAGGGRENNCNDPLLLKLNHCEIDISKRYSIGVLLMSK